MEIVKNFSKNLIENIPISEEPTNIDLILDGGVFNGSYLIGALFYLKEMESRNHYHVDRISGCSIGSLSALLYHIDALNVATDLYSRTIIHIKEHGNIDIMDTMFTIIKPLLPANICETMTNRVFITYYNIRSGKKVVKSVYKSVEDIFSTIKRSCFYPFLINGQPLYKDKYVDGMTPYIFQPTKNKKIMYLYLLGYDKWLHLFSVKNETNNFQRILSGLLDIHSFHVNKRDTLMCSFVNSSSLSFIIYNYGLKYILENIVFYILYCYLHLRDIFTGAIYIDKNNRFYKRGSKWMKKGYVFLLKKYCI